MTELENSSNEEKLLSLVEELQTENEQLQNQAEQYQTKIQQSSSEKQELKSLIAEQQKRIAEQKEKIAMLNESDKELLKSKQLLRESEQKLLESQGRMKEALTLKDRAETAMQQAKSESYEARAKSKQLQQKIDEGVKREAERIEREKEQAIKKENINHFAKVGSLTVALSLYCFVMTAIWLVDRWEIVKTVPQWFVNRWENIQTLWGGIVSVHSWAYKLLQPHMNDFIAKAIPFVVLLAIVALIGYFGVWKGLRFLKEKWSDLWRGYDYQNQTLLKVSTTIAIVTVSVPLAIFIAGFGGLNVVSWWLIFSIGLNVAYHAITYNL